MDNQRFDVGEEMPLFNQFKKQNKLLFNNHFIQNFFCDPKHVILMEKYLGKSNFETQQTINREFRMFYFNSDLLNMSTLLSNILVLIFIGGIKSYKVGIC